MGNSQIIELIWALAALAFPICVLLIVILFKKEICQLLGRVGHGKPPTETKNDERLIDKEKKDYKKAVDKIKPSPPSIHDYGEEPVKDLDRERQVEVRDEDYLFVDVCKNINSGKYFIVINEIEEDKAKMIIPNGEIKELELKLFMRPEQKDINKLVNDKQLTKEQIVMLKNYIDEEADDYIEKYIIKHRVQTKQTHITDYNDEPPYIKSYRSMLKNPDTFPSRMLQHIRNEQGVSCSRLRDILKDKYGYKSDTSGSFSASLRLLLVDDYIDIMGTGEDKIISINRHNK